MPEDGPSRGGEQAAAVVGVGNVLLGDEGLGVHVARELIAGQRPLPEGVAVFDAGTALSDLAGELARYPRVIIVDAIAAGGEPGTVYRVDLREALAEAGGAPALSLHDWGVLESLRAMELTGTLPPRLEMIGAEPESLAPGMALSPCLERAMRRIVDLLQRELGGAS